MKCTGFLLLFLLLLQQLTAQQSAGKIYGELRNIQNEPLPGATVTLLNSKDSISVAKMITTEKGVFEFSQLGAGTYYFAITAVGMKEYVSKTITINDKHFYVELPAIILQPLQSAQLKTVVITSKKPLLTQDIDKTIVNVDAMINSASNNALEILSKTPGVSVSNNDEIGLNGKDGVVVMIDGRATHLSASDLAAYLKSIPGDLLDKIELMDNPSSKYDAAGSAIINIRLKKNKKGGLTGSLAASYSQGEYARHTESVSLNYNRKRVNLFGNLSYGNEHNYSNDSYYRKFYADDRSLTSSVILSNFQKYSSASYMARLGMDFIISPKTTYGFIVNLNNNPRNSVLNYVSAETNEVTMLDSTGTGTVSAMNRRNNVGANIKFLHKFDSEGRELSADLNYINYSTPGTQNIFNTITGSDGSIINSKHFFYDLLPRVDIYTFKADYFYPLQNKGLLEAGIKSSFVRNDDNAQYFDVTNNAYTADYNKSNHFIYKEQVHALYLNARKSWSRLGLQLGLRAEQTQLNGNLVANAVTEQHSFSKQYINIFPSAFINYKLDSNGYHTLSANFSRRVRRPNYQQLNPFMAFRDNYSYSTGNPYINPQFQSRFEVKYQYRQLLGLSLQYGHFEDVIFDISEVVDEIFVTKPDNVATGNMFILGTNFNKNIFGWWSLNTNLMLAYMSLDGMAYTERLNASTATMRLHITNQFNLKKGWSAEMAAYYSGKDVSGQTIIQPRYRIYGGIQKKILKDKGSIRLIMEDIFHSWIQKDNTVSIKQASSYHINHSDTQRVGLAFTWRFGKDSFASKRKHIDNAADAETERAN